MRSSEQLYTTHSVPPYVFWSGPISQASRGGSLSCAGVAMQDVVALAMAATAKTIIKAVKTLMPFNT